MGRGIVIGVLGVLALFTASSATATRADAATEVQRPSAEAFVYLGQGRGYSIGLLMPNPRVALLHVFKAEGGPEALESGSFNYGQSSYAVRVRSSALSRGVIRARFPSIGKVALRFKPSGERRVHRAQGNCRGKRRVTEYGMFRGAISPTLHSWTGTLGVSLPGLGLPLTGEEFKTSLCVIDPKRTPAGCDFIEPKPVRGIRAGALMGGRHP